MPAETKKLSLEPYKGTRDFYPEDQFIQNYINGVWRSTVESFGYLEYGASILEETELYKAKTGDEIVNEQTYSFIDRGGRNVTIRPEMTPTVARMVAAKRKELSFPLRWYSIPNLFRYERPQRGRLREHWQLNVDIFGVEGIEADVEIISVAYEIMKSFGAKDGDFEIRLNNRKLLDAFNESFGLSEQSKHQFSKLLDKRSKIENKEFEKLAKEIVGDKINILLEAVNKMNVNDLPQDLKTNEGYTELFNLLNLVRNAGIKNVKYDPTLVRGFDYYTGNVFEILDTSPDNNRSLFGGGRYDDLVGIFGVDKVPGVGFGMGDVTTRDFLETHKLMPAYESTIDLYICHMQEQHLEFAQKLAGELRQQGLSVAVDLTDRKISNQVKTADRQKVNYLLVVGDDEVKSDTYKLKNMATGEERSVRAKEILPTIQGKR